MTHGKITTVKILKNVFVAKTNFIGPFKGAIEVKGSTPEIAREKLELFLNNKPYKHLV